MRALEISLSAALLFFFAVAGFAPLAGCAWAGWQKVCLGGTTTPSEACLTLDAAYAGAAGGVVGAHALNHDPYNALQEAISHPDAGAKP